MTGHIKMGADKDNQKDYLLVQPGQRVKSRYNPLAPKIGQGAGEFNDYTPFDFWTITNWEKGVGYHADAGVEGGYLYGEVDSRAGDEFILPPLLTVHTIESNVDASPSVNNINSGSPYQFDAPAKVAIRFFMDAPGPIYVMLNSQGIVNASIEGDNAGEPDGVSVWNGAATSDAGTMVMEWTEISNNFTPTLGVPYWLILEDDTGGFAVHAMKTQTDAGQLVQDNAGAWESVLIGDTYQAYVPYIAGDGGLGCIIRAETVGAELFLLCDDGEVYKYNPALTTFDPFADTGFPSFDMQLWFGKLVVTHGAGQNMSAVDASSGVVTPLTVPGELLAVWNGFLWRTVGNLASYSGDDITQWLDVVCGPDDYTIRGLAGLGDDMLVSTDQAVWRIAPGDWVFGVTKWAYQSANNGRGIINSQGIAYIPAGNTLVRYQVGASFLNIWKRDEALPSGKAGIIGGVIGTNKEVIVWINAAGQDTVWSWNNTGWHFVAKIPGNQTIVNMHYDSSNDYIWLFSDSGHAYSFYASSTVSNPNTDSLTTFHPSGWVDMGNYHGGLQTIVKDFDGVQAVGKNISPAKPVTIFWRDPGVISIESIFEQTGLILQQNDGEPLEQEVGGWSTLGEIVESGGAVRWEDYTTRPTGIGIHLAYSIRSDNIGLSPEISGIIVKYHAHVQDLYRWQLPMIASDSMEMVDGTIDPRTGAEIMAELVALDARTLPFWYTDVDGSVWEVKTISYAERTVKYEKVRGSEPKIQYVVDFGLQDMGYQQSHAGIQGASIY